MTWRPSALVRHGTRSFSSDSLRRAALSTFVAGGLLFIGWLDLTSLSSARAEDRARVRDGLHVSLIEAEGGLDGRACAQLGTLRGVVNAGGLKRLPNDRLNGDTATEVPRATVSSGLLTLLGARVPTSAGVILGPAIARQLRVANGATIQLRRSGRAAVRGVLPEDARGAIIAGWVLDVAPPSGRIEQCWVEFAPSSADPVSSVLAAFPNDGKLSIRPSLDVGRRARDLVAERSHRPALSFLGLGAALALILGAVLTVFRRAEFGLYSALGMSRTDRLVVLHVETWLAIAAAVLFAGPFLLWILIAATGRDIPHKLSLMSPADLRMAAADMAVFLCCCAALLPLPSLLAPLNTAEALKDR